MLVAVGVACVIAVLHLNDLAAAMMQVAGMAAPIANPSTDVTATPVPAPQNPANPAAGPGTPVGTCVSLPATGAPQQSQTVFVDAGHGGPDPGVVGTAAGRAVREKDLTLAVSVRLSILLRNDGYRVVMSRTGDSFVAHGAPAAGALTPDDVRRDLLARIACANASGATILVSIHFNGLQDPSVGGSETFYDAVRPFAAENKRLATDLQRSITSALGSSDRGVWPDSENVGPALSTAGSVYGHLIVLGPRSPGYVDSPSEMPGALVEPLFLSNPGDVQVAASAPAQQRIAQGLEVGIRGYINGA
jgi:N-acetylmuramoyl-L-alanine amidase